MVYFIDRFRILIFLYEGKQVYRVRDSITSLCTPLFMLFVGLCTQSVLYYYYQFFFQHRFMDWEISWAGWIGCFLFTDFQYYWFHRWSHQYNILWSAHSVHHSSEDFNLGTALRQSAFQGIFSSLMFYPINAICGMPYAFKAFHNNLNTICQFWFHTTLIGNLGPLEYILNTPVQHSRHHSRVPGECNSNYAGVLSIWDQMFGTFSTKPSDRFGLCDPAMSWNPFYDNFRHWVHMGNLWKKRRTFSDKLRILGQSGRFSNVRNLSMKRKYRFSAEEDYAQNFYLIFHHVLLIPEALYFMDILKKQENPFTNVFIWWSAFHFFATLYNLGSLFFYSGSWEKISKLVELIRVSLYAGSILVPQYSNPLQLPGVLLSEVDFAYRVLLFGCTFLPTLFVLESTNYYLKQISE